MSSRLRILQGLLALAAAGTLLSAQTPQPILFGSRETNLKQPSFFAIGPDWRARFETGRLSLRHGDQVVTIEFLGAAGGAIPQGIDPLPATVTIFSGGPHTSAQHFTTFAGIAYRNLQPGISAKFDLAGGRLKSEYRIEPGTDPRDIRFRYRGIRSLSVDSDGALHLHGPTGDIVESAPVAYQVKGGQRTFVTAAFQISEASIAGFRVGPYDASTPLIIDPTLTFANSIGGSGIDQAMGIAKDSASNIYVAGWTDSPNFASAPYTPPPNHSVDAFVMKLDPNKNLLNITYLGGSGDDRAFAIAVDPNGYAYVCGWTQSTNFPVLNAPQAALIGSRNAFVSLLDPTGKTLLFSTYIGGSGQDSANAIAIDLNGNAYVAGETTSPNFPAHSAFQPSLGGVSNAFVAKFSRSGAVQYSTYLGGRGTDRGLGIAVDSSGNAYITGGTTSPNFPVLGAFQKTLGGGQDAFVTKLNPSGSGLVYSTFLGGAGGTLVNPEQGNAIAVDSTGNAYVAGTTSSTNFPVQGAYQGSFRGWQNDAFVTKLDPTGSKLVYSTYLGGSDMDVATSIHLDTQGEAYIAGYTASVDFPLAQPLQAVTGGLLDTFLAKLSTAGNSLLFSTYLGGSQNDVAYSLAGVNEVIVAGTTASTNLFPSTVSVNALLYGVQIAPFAPFGSLDTPPSGLTGVNGAIGFTGWVLCEDQVPTAEIWRDPVPGESGMVYVATAAVFQGTRPDVAAAFSGYPYRNITGFGVQVLTNMLPDSNGSGGVGNGSYTFYGLSRNLQGQVTQFGKLTMNVNNASAVLPFGTIDTPADGATISGNAYINFGWVLTPQPSIIPTNGSTITVYIDNAAVGHPNYGWPRADLAALFANYRNSAGPVGYFYIDTTKLANGIHTIYWEVSDSNGHQTGIGSRFFSVQN